MKRLDQFLVLDNLIESWGVDIQTIGSISIYDISLFGPNQIGRIGVRNSLNISVFGMSSLILFLLS